MLTTTCGTPLAQEEEPEQEKKRPCNWFDRLYARTIATDRALSVEAGVGLGARVRVRGSQRFGVDVGADVMQTFKYRGDGQVAVGVEGNAGINFRYAHATFGPQARVHDKFISEFGSSTATRHRDSHYQVWRPEDEMTIEAGNFAHGGDEFSASISAIFVRGGIGFNSSVYDQAYQEAISARDCDE